MHLEKLFEYQLMGRLIEFAITHDDLEYCQKDILDIWKRSQRTLKKELLKLAKIGLIRESRRIANSIQYRTNKECPLYPIIKMLMMELSQKKYEVGTNE